MEKTTFKLRFLYPFLTVIHTYDEDIVDPGCEGVPTGILDVDDVERSRMSLPGHDGSHSTSVSSASHHAQVAGVELDRILDLTRGNVHLDGIINLNIWYN